MPAEDRSWQVLIVEDDPLIGMMLKDMLVELGCAPLGPAGSVAAALLLIASSPQLDGAVLDCNLGAEDVWPVADRLTERNVPFVFATAYGRSQIEPRFVDIPVLPKPYPQAALTRTLLPLLKNRA